jgi:hypothetical protein
MDIGVHGLYPRTYPVVIAGMTPAIPKAGSRPNHSDFACTRAQRRSSGAAALLDHRNPRRLDVGDDSHSVRNVRQVVPSAEILQRSKQSREADATRLAEVASEKTGPVPTC